MSRARLAAPTGALLLVVLFAGVAAGSGPPGGAVGDDEPFDTEVVNGGDEPFVAGILDGDVATENPGLGRLSVRLGGGAVLRCGGSFVAPTWFLTAAHCVEPLGAVADAVVETGGPDLGQDAPGRQVLAVLRVVVHPAWDPAGLGRGDLALLELARAASITPVALVGPHVQPDWSAGLRAGAVLGWGNTAAGGQPSDVLVLAPQQVYRDGACRRLVGTAYDPARHVCHDGFSRPHRPATACPGDSGGPLFVTDTERRTAVGGVIAFSIGPPGCTGADLTVSSRVSAFAGWIHDVTGVEPLGGIDPPPGEPGYWLATAGGDLIGFGAAIPQPGRAGAARGAVVALATTPVGDGVWLLTDAGEVLAFGAARALGDVGPGTVEGRPASIAVTPAGDGYWVFTDRGEAVAFGAAPARGDLAGVALNGPVVASAATPSGKGYWMIGADGGVFAFGDASFRGSMGGGPLNEAVNGIVADPDGEGYWLVASDGGVFAFDAPFLGSMGGAPLNARVVGGVGYGRGYLLVAADGGIFAFSDRPFLGSLGADPPPDPVVAVTAFTG